MESHPNLSLRNPGILLLAFTILSHPSTTPPPPLNQAHIKLVSPLVLNSLLSCPNWRNIFLHSCHEFLHLWKEVDGLPRCLSIQSQNWISMVSTGTLRVGFCWEVFSVCLFGRSSIVKYVNFFCFSLISKLRVSRLTITRHFQPPPVGENASPHPC